MACSAQSFHPQRTRAGVAHAPLPIPVACFALSPRLAAPLMRFDNRSESDIPSEIMPGELTFEIAEITELSGLSIPQIEQAISREGIEVRGRGRPRQFLDWDAFMFCLIGDLRRLGIDWKRIQGSTAFPWPIDDLSEIDKTHFLLLTPMADDAFEVTPAMPDQIAKDLKSFNTTVGILIDASAIKKRIETFARKRR